MKKSTINIPYKGTAGLQGQVKIQYPARKNIYPVKTNKIYTKDTYNIQLQQIQYTVSTNTMSSEDKYNILFKTNTKFSIDKYNVEIFSDIICAVNLGTSRKFWLPLLADHLW